MMKREEVIVVAKILKKCNKLVIATTYQLGRNDAVAATAAHHGSYRTLASLPLDARDLRPKHNKKSQEKQRYDTVDSVY